MERSLRNATVHTYTYVAMLSYWVCANNMWRYFGPTFLSDVFRVSHRPASFKLVPRPCQSPDRISALTYSTYTNFWTCRDESLR